ncbi:MAG: hypothetical protein KME19_23025 [Microcoleus vaginatus WJT46-NPBG5]|nr:hypothetical protein [Microcoleus vaginatus WJT46-NPBG5]
MTLRNTLGGRYKIINYLGEGDFGRTFVEDLSFTQYAPVGRLPMCDLWGNERMVWGWVLVSVCLLFRVDTRNISNKI